MSNDKFCQDLAKESAVQVNYIPTTKQFDIYEFHPYGHISAEIHLTTEEAINLRDILNKFYPKDKDAQP